MQQVYRVRNWETAYETAETRKYKRLKWVPVGNSLSTREYGRLMGGEANGHEHLAAWDLILRVVSAVEHRALRGYLVDERGEPLNAQGLADITRAPVRIFEEALPRLLGRGLQLLEVAPVEEYRAALVASKLHPGPGGGGGLPVKSPVSTADAPEPCEPFESEAEPCGAKSTSRISGSLRRISRHRTGTGTGSKPTGGCSLDAGLQARRARARARTYSSGPDLTGRNLPTHLAGAAAAAGVSPHLVAEAVHEGRDEACVLSWLGKAARWRDCRNPDGFFRWGVATGGESTLGDHNAAKRILRGAFRPAPAVARACRAERLAKRERDRAVWKYRRLRKLAGRLPVGLRGRALRDIAAREAVEMGGAA